MLEIKLIFIANASEKHFIWQKENQQARAITRILKISYDDYPVSLMKSQ